MFILKKTKKPVVANLVIIHPRKWFCFGHKDNWKNDAHIFIWGKNISLELV